MLKHKLNVTGLVLIFVSFLVVIGIGGTSKVTTADKKAETYSVNKGKITIERAPDERQFYVLYDNMGKVVNFIEKK